MIPISDVSLSSKHISHFLIVGEINQERAKPVVSRLADLVCLNDVNPDSLTIGKKSE